MVKSKFIKNIFISVLTGFLILVVILWLDKWLDFPHRFFGAPATPINITESVFETMIVLILALLVMLTCTLLKIKSLEGLIPVCSFCQKIRVDNRWVSIFSYISNHSEADFTHGVCPKCAAEHYSDILNLKKSKKEKDL